MPRRLTTTAALVGATTLLSVAAAPALAAPIVAQSSANALTVEIAGEGASSGTVRAVHDGDRERVTGQTQPPIDVLEGQQLLQVGTLSQQATADLRQRLGVSAACSGVAGDGATVAEIGTGDCLSGGDNVGLSIANLDLSGLVVFNPDSPLGPGNDVTTPLIEQLVGPLTAAVSEGLAPLGEVSIQGTAGVIEAQCQADPDSAAGDAQIADAQLTATLGGEQLTLARLDADPAPNTKVVTDLDVVTNLVIDSVERSVAATLSDPQFAPLVEQLGAATGQGQEQIVTAVVGQVSDQLEPLERDVLDITLNRQVRPTANSIEVTAIAADVLPAAAEQLGAPLVSADIANVTCGPGGQVEPAPAQAEKLPAVPTVINSGDPGSDSGARGALIGGIVVAGLAGLVARRRPGAASRQ